MHSVGSRELSHDRVAGQFDELMNEYDVTRRIEVLVDQFLTPQILTAGLVLDAGCGTGRGTHTLRQRGASVVALDIGYNLIKSVKLKYHCAATQSSILSLPFADQVFDVVFSSEVIEHTPDPAQAVRELYRVLKSRGHLVLSTPNWWWRWSVSLASRLGFCPYDALENWMRPGELRRVIESMGGQVLAHRGIHLWPFQLRVLNRWSRWMDRYGRILLPIMINQCMHCIKPGANPTREL
jgi:2-polyprenyl-3-methyl-5-hydroxy-6-metoxy-1,4-benzoquinol methylase